MPNKDANKISSGLQNKGFILKEKRDHKYFFYYSTSGKKTEVFTKISHGSKSKVIDDNLFSQMSKQCRLLNSEFSNLIECPLKRDEYEIKLSAKEIKLT